ncbi:MAG: twin-arginine translocation signal domain-containing protein [Planctomycetaceae bacterium]
MTSRRHFLKQLGLASAAATFSVESFGIRD